jgi:uncharacterized membrane protein
MMVRSGIVLPQPRPVDGCSALSAGRVLWYDPHTVETLLGMELLNHVNAKEVEAMLVAKLLSEKNLEKLEQNLNAFLASEEGAQTQAVSGVSVVPHPTVGAATYVIVVTLQK